jgi:hypothetical protein
MICPQFHFIAPVEDMDWGDGHWAMRNHGNNQIVVNQHVTTQNFGK